MNRGGRPGEAQPELLIRAFNRNQVLMRLCRRILVLF
jgi:hypothetical protein